MILLPFQAARRFIPSSGCALVAFFAFLGFASLAWSQSPVPTNAPAGYPTWWFSQGVIVPTNPSNNTPSWPGDYPASDDFYALNQGTLKNLATAANAHFLSLLPPAILAQSNAVALQNMISGWITNPSPSADNYAAVNQGQLKALAGAFYDVLATINYTAGQGYSPTNWVSGAYPWSASTNAADNYLLANIGEAKYLFSFDLSAPAGQVPAWWTQYYFPGQTNFNPNSLSSLGDGYTLLQEYQLGRNPNDFFNGVLPSLSVVSGSGQTGSPGGLLPQPLVIAVKTAANNPWPNAPVTFTVGAGGGTLQASSSSTPVTSLSLRTDAGGLATVYYQLPATVSATTTVTCTVTSPSATGGTASESVSFAEASDDGSGTYASPFTTPGLVATVNADGSMDIPLTGNTNTTDPIVIHYRDADGNWQVLATAPAGSTSYHIPAQ